MSFQQKNVAVSLGSFMLILLFYVLRVSHLLRTENFTLANMIWVWGIIAIIAIVVTIAGMILTHTVSAIVEVVKTGNEDPKIDVEDERDQLIDLKGTRVSYTVYSVGVLLAMLAFAFGQPGLVLFTLLILCGILAQITGDVFRLVLYRRGF